MLEFSASELVYYSKKYSTYNQLRKNAISRENETLIVTLQGTLDYRVWVDLEVLQGKEAYNRLIARPEPAEDTNVMTMDNQTLQLVIAMQHSLCDLLEESRYPSGSQDKARHIAKDAARIIEAQGQQPRDVPEWSD